MLAGAGGNYTFGSWLFKAEAAWLYGFEYAYVDSVILDTPLGPFPFPRLSTPPARSRGSTSWGGVEYYGFNETTLALEIVNRHIFDYERPMRGRPHVRARGTPWSTPCATRRTGSTHG